MEKNNFRIYIIKKDCDDQKHYSLAFQLDQKTDFDVLEQLLNHNGNLIYEDNESGDNKLESSQVVIRPQRELSETQKNLCKLADLVREGLIISGGLLGKVIVQGGTYAITLIDKDQKEVKVNPKLLKFLVKLEKGSKKLYDIAKDKLQDLGEIIGKKIVKECQEKPQGRVGKVLGDDNVKTVVHVVAGVLDGMFQVGEQVFISLTQVGTQGVNKKYGPQAAQAFNQGAHIINNVTDITNIHKDVLREQAYKQIKEVNNK